MMEQEYVDKAIEFLQSKFPDMNFIHTEGFSIKTNKDGGFTFNLETPFKRSTQNDFTSWQDDLFEFIQRIFKCDDEIKNRADNPDYMQLDNIKEKIFPFIKNKAFIDSSRKSFMNENGTVDESVTLVYKPFLLDNLYICWGIDIGSGYRFLRKKDLVEFGISVNELDTLSKENLEALPQTQQFNGAKNPETQLDEALWWEGVNDGLTASLIILIKDHYNFFSEHLGKQFYISVPERDFLMMHRIGGNIDNLKKDNEEQYKNSAHPICDKVILVDDGKFSYVV